MFSSKQHIFDVLEQRGSDFIKKFLTRFPEIVIEDIESISDIAYRHNIIDFIIKICHDDNIIVKYLENFLILSYEENNLDILNHLLNLYQDKIKNIILNLYDYIECSKTMILILEKCGNNFDNDFYNDFYDKLFRNNNEIILQYMFDNFNYDYTKKLINFPINEMMVSIQKMILDDVLKKNFLLSMNVVEIFFRKYCHYGDLEYAYKIKSQYPNINTYNISYDSENMDLHYWISHGCPIVKMTKSSRKVI